MKSSKEPVILIVSVALTLGSLVMMCYAIHAHQATKEWYNDASTRLAHARYDLKELEYQCFQELPMRNDLQEYNAYPRQ